MSVSIRVSVSRATLLLHTLWFRRSCHPGAPHPTPAHRWTESPVGATGGTGLDELVATPNRSKSSLAHRVTRGGVVDWTDPPADSMVMTVCWLGLGMTLRKEKPASSRGS